MIDFEWCAYDVVEVTEDNYLSLGYEDAVIDNGFGLKLQESSQWIADVASLAEARDVVARHVKGDLPPWQQVMCPTGGRRWAFKGDPNETPL